MLLSDNSSTASESKDTKLEPTRDEERDDVAEADAPTAEEENAGMSTILGADPVTGVQRDADDE